MYLVDSSVWIGTFRKRDPLDVESLVPIEEIVTCLPIVQEVLQGFRDERAFRLAKESLLSFPIVESPLRAEVFEQAVDLFRAARRVGSQVRSSIDCLIAACALRNHLVVLHVDRDYEALANVSALRQQRA